jgi:hypothetical protein
VCVCGERVVYPPMPNENMKAPAAWWCPRPGQRLARRSDDTEAVSAKHQACLHLAVHVHPDRTLETGATEMGAAIGCPRVGDSTRGTETAEPLTSTPASCAARLGTLNGRSVPRHSMTNGERLGEAARFPGRRSMRRVERLGLSCSSRVRSAGTRSTRSGRFDTAGQFRTALEPFLTSNHVLETEV